MEGKKVELWLHTPIFLKAEVGLRKVHGLSGEVKQALSGGIVLRPSEFWGEREDRWSATTAQDLFLPIHKIDHLFLL